MAGISTKNQYVANLQVFALFGMFLSVMVMIFAFGGKMYLKNKKINDDNFERQENEDDEYMVI